MTNSLETPVRKVNTLVDDIERLLYEIENDASTHDDLIKLFSEVSNKMDELVDLYKRKDILTRVSRAYERFYEENRVYTGIDEFDRMFRIRIGRYDELNYDDEVYKITHKVLTTELPNFIEKYNIDFLNFIREYGDIVTVKELIEDSETKKFISLLKNAVKLYRVKEHLSPMRQITQKPTYSSVTSTKTRNIYDDENNSDLSYLGWIGLGSALLYGAYKVGFFNLVANILDHYFMWILWGSIILYAIAKDSG